MEIEISYEPNWEAYWEKFKEKHGKLYVPYKNRFIFPDGWMYAQKLEGPEYPPPSSAKAFKGILLKYWTIRVREEERVLNDHKLVYEKLENISLQYSSEVPYTKITYNPETEEEHSTVEVPKLEELKQDILDREEHLSKSRNKLKEIKNADATRLYEQYFNIKHVDRETYIDK